MMAEFVIIPDSSSDFTRPLRQRFDIPDYTKGLVYFPDGRSEFSDVDLDTHELTKFYESMSDKKTIYKTSCPPAGHIFEVYEKYLAQGKDVLAITLSSALSGTYQTCQMVAKNLLAKYPERKIICVDSLRYSSAIALLVILAAQKRDAGATIEETAAFLEEQKYRVHQMGPMDDLFFLVKTGRISNFKALFGTLVGINPMADINRNGLSEVLAKFKGKTAAFNATIEYIRQTIERPEEQTIFVAHSNRSQAAELLAQRIRDTFSPKEVIISHIGMSCGSSIGPGLCAAYYLGTAVSENMENEKAVMNTIIENQQSKK